MNSEALVTRRAPLIASTWNPEAWTFEATLSAGASVVRWDERGQFDEVLSLAQAAWPARVPLLDSHDRSTLDAALGSVDQIAASGGELRGRATLSRNSPRSQRVAADLTDGHTFALSIGYVVNKWSERTNPKTGRREKVAEEIDLREASIVVVPADPAARIRSEDPMPETTTTPAITTTPTAPVATRATVNAEIRALASSLNLPTSWADGMIDNESTTEQARSAALDAVIARSASTPPISTARAHIVHDHNDPTQIRGAMADAIAHRLAPSRVKLEGRATEFRGLGLVDMVGELARARGERIDFRDRAALVERAVGAHSTGDFPMLLSDAANKSLLANYQAAEPTYRKWAAQRPFADFRDHSFLRIGDFPQFKEVAETGELEFGTIGENREKVRPKQLDAGIIIGRRALLNDDLSALADFSSMIAIRAAADENARAYGVLTANAALADGVALFHANHKNLAASGLIIGAGLDAAVAALRAQIGLDGVPLNIAPRFLIVSVADEAAARRSVADISPATADAVNPWAGAFEVIADANLTGKAWYLAADPAAAPTVVFGYVGGASGPEIRTEVDFDTRSVKVAAGLDFAVGAIDFRGIFKNPGQ